MDQLVFTIPEAATVLRLSRSTIYQEIAAGRLEAISVGRRRLVRREALVAFLDCRSAAETAAGPRRARRRAAS